MGEYESLSGIGLSWIDVEKGTRNRYRWLSPPTGSLLWDIWPQALLWNGFEVGRCGILEFIRYSGGICEA